MRHASKLLLLAALLAAIPAVAGARQPAPGVWATVNVCDTAARPNELGIRGGMAGLPRSARMFMRFRVQFRAADDRWQTIGSADSRWQRVGAGQGGEHDAGWTFRFKPPASGGAHVLRGLVTFEWRRGGRVVARTRTVTEAGHPGTAGAEPADFSAATCEIA